MTDTLTRERREELESGLDASLNRVNYWESDHEALPLTRQDIIDLLTALRRLGRLEDGDEYPRWTEENMPTMEEVTARGRGLAARGITLRPSALEITEGTKFYIWYETCGLAEYNPKDPAGPADVRTHACYLHPEVFEALRKKPATEGAAP